MGNTLAERVLQYAKSNPKKDALIYRSNVISYGELANSVVQTAKKLKDVGVRVGNRVLLSAPSKPEYIIGYLGIQLLGAVIVPLHKGMSADDARTIFDLTKPVAVISDNGKYGAFCGEKLLPMKDVCAMQNIHDTFAMDMHVEPVEPSEPCEILFTSGTTGKPKGAVLSYEAVSASIKNTSDGMGMLESDILLLPLPLNHSFGLRVLRSALANGETVVLQNGFTFAKEMTSNIIEHNCTCMACVVSGFEMIRQQIGDNYRELLGKLRYIEFSAGAVPLALRKELITALPNTTIFNTWGSTESGGALFLNVSAETDRIESAGIPINDIRVKAIDENGNETRGIGRICISGSNILSSYYGNDELTEATIQEEWLLTGDSGYIDEDGYVYLKGRLDDLISIGGEKVAPIDIEKLVEASGFVRECAVVGVNDNLLGQVPVAFVIPEAGYDESKVTAFIREKSDSFRVPKCYITVDSFPRNYMGKLDRKELKRMWESTKTQRSANDKIEKKNLEQKTENVADIVYRTMITRRSIRYFKDIPIPRDILEKLCTVGRLAPCGHNMQTWQFTVIENPKRIDEIKHITGEVAKIENTAFYGFLNPQALIIVSNDPRNFDATQNCAAAIENILLLAHAYGLGATWLNSWIHISDCPKIREILTLNHVPREHIVYGMVALGYPKGEVKTPIKKEDVIVFDVDFEKGEDLN